MSNCNHENYDEYFEKCTDCNASRQQVIADDFKNRLQAVYRDMQNTLGIDTGDIMPEQAVRLEEAENNIASAVSEWLESRCLA